MKQQGTKTHGNMPAFGSSEAYGLTKREYFAAAALSGLLSDSSRNGNQNYYSDLAVNLADALILSLNCIKTKTNDNI